MEEIQVPEVVAIKIQFGELNLNPLTLNGLQKINTLGINLKNLPPKLQHRIHIYQQVLLNSNIGCKSYITSNIDIKAITKMGQKSMKLL